MPFKLPNMVNTMGAPRELLVEIDLKPRMHGTIEKAEEVENTVSILVDVNDPRKVLKIRNQMRDDMKNQLTAFLKENLVVFAWFYSDMAWIDPRVMCHHLNIDPEKRGIR